MDSPRPSTTQPIAIPPAPRKGYMLYYLNGQWRQVRIRDNRSY